MLFVGLGIPGFQKNTWPINHYGIPLTSSSSRKLESKVPHIFGVVWRLVGPQDYPASPKTQASSLPVRCSFGSRVRVPEISRTNVNTGSGYTRDTDIRGWLLGGILYLKLAFRPGHPKGGQLVPHPGFANQRFPGAVQRYLGGPGPSFPAELGPGTPSNGSGLKNDAEITHNYPRGPTL